MRQITADKDVSKNSQDLSDSRWHTAVVKVQVSDTDYGGGVYHGRYFNLYDQAREAFWEDVGVTPFSLKQQGVVLTVAELHTLYNQPVFYGDILEIRTRLLWFREKSMGLAQDITGTDPETGRSSLRNQAEINLVCTVRGKAAPMPGQLVRAITAYYGI